jgi:hypothetical protein
MTQIDPVEFGRVLARLDEQDRQSAEAREEIRQMREEIRSLLALANRGKGALFVLTGIGTIVGGVFAVFVEHWFRKG